MQGGMVVFHPWRCSGKCGDDENPYKYRSRTRYLAPHFHVVGFGFFKETSAALYGRSGWVYKNLDDRTCKHCRTVNRGNVETCYRCRALLPERNVQSTVWYLLEHAGIDASGDKVRRVVRYFGTVQDLRQPGDEQYTIKTELLCPCGAHLAKHHPDPEDGVSPGEFDDYAYEVVKVRIYYRSERARAPRGAPDRWYNVASEDPANKPRQEILAVAA